MHSKRPNGSAKFTGSPLATAKQAEYSYYPGLDDPHALIVGDTQYFAHTDGLGNVIALTDKFETVQRTYGYDAWGQPVGGADYAAFGGKDRPRFKGALWLGPEVEVYYMRARWYEPKTGRFLSEDPIGLAGGLNPYVYAADDPVNGSDPLGLCAVGLYDSETGAYVGRRSQNASEGEQMVGRDGRWYTCEGGRWVPSHGAGGSGGRQDPGGIGRRAEEQCVKAGIVLVFTGAADVSGFRAVWAGLRATRAGVFALNYAHIRSADGARMAAANAGYAALNRRLTASAAYGEAATGYINQQGVSGTLATMDGANFEFHWSDVVPLVGSWNALRRWSDACFSPGAN